MRWSRTSILYQSKEVQGSSLTFNLCQKENLTAWPWEKIRLTCEEGIMFMPFALTSLSFLTYKSFLSYFGCNQEKGNEHNSAHKGTDSKNNHRLLEGQLETVTPMLLPNLLSWK